MRKLFKLMAMLCAFAMVGLTACQDDPQEPTPTDPFEGASLEVKLVGADVDRATVSVTAEVLKATGYVVMPVEGEMTAPTAADIFTNGKLENIVEGKAEITFRNLEPETNYVAYFAGRISSDKVWDQVKEFKFKTAAEPIVPVLTAKLIGTEATSAEIELYAENISRVAYLAKPLKDGQMPETPSLQVIFATGKVAEVVQGDNTLTIKGLLPNTEYVAFIAGEIAGIEEYMEEVQIVKYIKTSDFADDIAVRDITYRGFTVDVKVDPSVKEQNHMIKWSTSSLYLYNRNGGSPMRDAEIMNLHDTAWGGMNLFNESTSIIIDELHSYVYNEYGEPLENYYYEALVPGQPQVFIAGEYRRGESPLGWGMGYYKPMFDYDQYRSDASNGTVTDETAYWDGFYQHIDVQVKKPVPLPEDMLTVEITPEPGDATVKVTADESLDQVAIMMMSEYEYNVASQWLPDEHMQWFATSIEAIYEGVTMIIDPFREDLGFNGTIQTALSEYFYEIPRESKFWVWVVGLRGDADGDGFLDGHEQVCKAYEFYLPQPTKPAPELIVTALESTSPYEVSFNVKCPTKDVQKGKCIANYEKEWLMAGMSAQDIVYNYGIDFTTVEIMKINTDEGLTLTYPSRPDAKTYLGVMIANDEGSETYSDAVIATSLPEPAAERVESELFESLQGEWTATANVTYQLYNTETDEYEPQTAVHTCDMTIGAVEYPETMREEDYATFERHGVDRETATAYYEEFKAAAATFNENTRAQNRILVNGFDFAGGYQNYFTYSDPYSLFVSDTYNGFTSEMPLYDFGPKWYLEVAEDGTVTAPFNTNYFAPMSSWYAENNAIYESFFVAYQPEISYIVGFVGDADGNVVNGQFPVEISEDGNTITLKPLVHEGTNYYPNSAINYGLGRFGISIAVNSDIVLTRKSAAEAPAKVARKSGKIQKQTAKSAQKIVAPARPASRQAIGEKVEYKMVAGPKHFNDQERGQMWVDARRMK